MIHLACFLIHSFTVLFVSSRYREHNKKLVRSLLVEAVSTSKIHLNALFFSNMHAKLKETSTSTFWSRTEFLTLKEEKPLLVLPAGVGIVYKVSLGLKDFALYVWALSLPIYFTVFELMRALITVDPHVRRIVHTSSWKCAVLLLCCAAPHFLLVKAIRGGRVRRPFLGTLCCVVAIIFAGVFVLPGTTGSVWNRNFRFFPYAILVNVAPPTILRAVSHSASSLSLVAVFVLLHMYLLLSSPFKLFLPIDLRGCRRQNASLPFASDSRVFFFSFGCYGLYRNYWLPYLADEFPRHSDSVHAALIRSDFFRNYICCHVLVAAQVCVCILLDKRHHVQNTGRKCFVAPR